MPNNEVIQGGAKLDRMLAGLANKAAKKIVRSTVTQAIKIPKTQMASNAKTMIGGKMGSKIASSVQARAHKKQRPGSYARFVSLKTGIPEFIHTAKDGKQTYIPAAIEFGHDDVAPIPFARDAVDTTRARTVKRTKDLITAGILRHAKANR